MVFSRLFTIVLASVALFFTCQVHASQSVNLAWDPNSEQDLAGYRVYFGTGSGNYTQTMEVATPSSTVPGLTEGVVYYFAVTAYNTEGEESGYSNEVSYAVPTSTPAQPEALLNISTRVRVRSGDSVLIGGFIVTGDATKEVVIRALGPSLARSGVS